MKTIAYIRWADPPLWIASLANLFPLWLLSFAFMAGAFGLGITAFIISIVVLLWLGWFTPELILYSLFPFASLFIFEEVPVRYEIPFRLLCVLLLTLGIVGYRLSTQKLSRNRLVNLVGCFHWNVDVSLKCQSKLLADGR